MDIYHVFLLRGCCKYTQKLIPMSVHKNCTSYFRFKISIIPSCTWINRFDI